MTGLYEATNGKINFTGNRLYNPVTDVTKASIGNLNPSASIKRFEADKHFYHLHRIDNAVFEATTNYFKEIHAEWCNLPLTTRMISSPGEVYAGEKLDYTTDSMPISLRWFGESEIFLSESSQFYLELRLIIDKVDKVFSIYNSFRKERSDFSHLVEFQHIEFEGHVDFEQNIEIYLDLLRHITNHILTNHKDDLVYYLSSEEIDQLSSTFEMVNIETLTFEEAMNLLYRHSKESKYKETSLKNFGSYEEILLTRIVGKHCNIIEFPVNEIPFYHDSSYEDVSGRLFAKNADLILFGYREVVGSGQRITNLDYIKEKARFFNLPERDYDLYIKMRKSSKYRTTCGFGLGWQRYTQWLLKMPFIWELSHTPRTHLTPSP